MILVADRCAMSGQAMAEMKERIIEVVSDFVDVDEELGVEVNMSQDPEIQGTMYAVGGGTSCFPPGVALERY
jgi:septum formation topological specificity factor MinE